MENEKLIKYPPLVETTKSPTQIVGRENLDLFMRFLQICFSATNAGEFPHKRVDKEIGKENRDAIAETLRELRLNGFYPVAVNDQKIVWKYVTKSKTTAIFDSGLSALKGRNRDELANIARAGYRQFVNG